MSGSLSLGEALRILEVVNPDGVDLRDLPILRRKAQKRWHPDTIAALRPEAETVARYEASFHAIDDAIETLKAYIKGERAQAVDTPPPPEEPEAVIRRNAAGMQTSLREKWMRARGSLTGETTILAPGIPIADLLKQDLDDHVPAQVFAGWIGGALPLTILWDSGVPRFAGRAMEWYALPAFAILLTFTAICLLMIVPMARFWLPPRVTLVGLYAVNIGLWFFRAMDWLMRWTGRLGPIFMLAYFAFVLVVIVPVAIVRVAQFIILRPLYYVVGQAMADRHLGRITTRERVWFGVPAPEVERLLAAEASTLTQRDLFTLSGLYSAAAT
ncbi:MAG: hypothetical protein RIE23_07785 [Pontimonas sp.]